MTGGRVAEEQVSIFNMSFLDVFCCTVGALLFILFIQTLRTRDMVERRELAAIQARRDEAENKAEEAERRRDLADRAAKAAEERRMHAEEAAEDAERRRKEAEEEARQAKKSEQKWKEAYDRIKRAGPVATGSETRKEADLAGGSGGAIETQKTSRGQYLLGNLETRSIVCASEGLYLGLSRKVIPIHNNNNLPALFRQFLRYHDPKEEGLWRTVWGEGAESYVVSYRLQKQESGQIGQGLVVRKDTAFQTAQRMATQQNKNTIDVDTDGDGNAESQYRDEDNDGTLDVKLVNVDEDPFLEEVYLDYDSTAGQWARLLADTDGDDQREVLYRDTIPSDADYEVKLVLPHSQTGKSVFAYEDSDNNGVWDRKNEEIDLTNESTEKTYLQFDLRRKRWGVIAEDSDGNGVHEVLWLDTDMTNDDWEEKHVDANQDGAWDIRWKDLDPRDNDWEARFTNREPVRDVWRRCELDSDADGAFDVMLEDKDGDGEWDEESVRDPQTGKWTSKRSS